MVWMHETVEEMDAEGGGAWPAQGRWRWKVATRRPCSVWTGEAAPEMA